MRSNRLPLSVTIVLNVNDLKCGDLFNDNETDLRNIMFGAIVMRMFSYSNSHVLLLSILDL